MANIKQIKIDSVTYDITAFDIIETNNGLKQKFWRGTKAEYDAIETKDETTMYIVTDGADDSDQHGGVQSDWNQNDETAPDYVKNRTHYDNRNNVTTESVTIEGLTADGGYLKVADSIDFDIDNLISLSRISNADGITYENAEVYLSYDQDDCKTVNIYELSTYDILGVYFPSQSDADISYGSSEDNPFTAGLYLYVDVYDEDGEQKGLHADITYSLTYAAGELHQIDSKYIKDAYYDKTSFEIECILDSFNFDGNKFRATVNNEFIEFMRESSNYNEILGEKIFYFKRVDVNINGINKSFISDLNKGDNPPFGHKYYFKISNGNNYFRFDISGPVEDIHSDNSLLTYKFYVNNDGIIIPERGFLNEEYMTERYFGLKNKDVFKISIKCFSGEFKKLDEKYLPDTAVQSNWSQNDKSKKDYILNRTHYEEYVETDVIVEQQKIEFSDDTGLGFEAPIANFNINDLYAIWIDGIRYNLDFETYEDNVFGTYIDFEDSSLIVVIEYGNMIIAQERFNVTAPQSRIIKICKLEEHVVKLDKKYLPDDILPASTSADNGKFLRVVDGIPAWSTVQNAEEVEF